MSGRSVHYFLASISGSESIGGPFAKLDFVGNDVGRFRALAELHGIGGVVRVNTKNSKHSFLEEFEDCLQTISSCDLFVFYFSGHGFVDRNGDFFLVSNDSTISPDGILHRGLYFKDIVKEVRRRERISRGLYILDCCFSGAGIDALSEELSDENLAVKSAQIVEQEINSYQRVIKEMDKSNTQFFISSARANEASFGGGALEQSFFSNYLLDGIERGVADVNGDGEVSYLDLVAYFSEEPKISSARNARFYPSEADLDEERDFGIFSASMEEKERENAEVLEYYRRLHTDGVASSRLLAAVEKIIQSSLNPRGRDEAMAVLDQAVRNGRDGHTAVDEIAVEIFKSENRPEQVENVKALYRARVAELQKSEGEQKALVEEGNRRVETLEKQLTDTNRRGEEAQKLLSDKLASALGDAEALRRARKVFTLVGAAVGICATVVVGSLYVFLQPL